MTQEERFALDDERDRIVSIDLTPEMYREFESRYKLAEIVTGHRRILYDQKNTIRRRSFIEDTDNQSVWRLGQKKNAHYDFELKLHTFEDEVYNMLVRCFHNISPDSIEEHHVALMDDPNLCSFTRLIQPIHS